ncbi:MAG: CHASE domain-containing protein [Bdellovibrionales bacterium]|nr:CHASE domain-containing protein [Bdellovibrionales bacterium]
MIAEPYFSRLPPGLRRVVVGALLCLAYYALAKAGLELATINRSTSPIWPASGFAIASLFLFGRRYAPAIFLGALIANAQTRAGPIAVVLIAFGNMTEAIVGAVVFERALRLRRALFGGETLVALAGGVLLATPISASVGSFALWFSAAIGRSEIGSNWLTWWIGDSIGVVSFAPFFLQVLRPRPPEEVPLIWRPRPRWAVVKVLMAAVAAYVCFHPGNPPALLFAVYPVLWIAAWILSPREAAWVTVIATGVAIAATTFGKGPFLIGSPNENLICLALFLASLSITEQGLRFVRETGAVRHATVILLVGWALGAFLLQGFARNEEMVDSARFQQLADGALAHFRQRALLYEAALHGGVGLFSASRSIRSKEWRAYVASLDLDLNYPGLLGIGYIDIVPHAELANYVQRIRAEGNPGFRYHTVAQTGIVIPVESQQTHFIINSVEPRERNAEAMGLDVASESNRYEGAMRALRSGKPEVTRPIRLVQDDLARVGFLLYLPILADGKPKGWVYAPLVFEDFLGKAEFGNAKEIGFQIYFDDDGAERTPFYTDLSKTVDPATEPFIRAELPVWGRKMIFRWYRTSAFRSRHDTTLAWVLLVSAFVVVLVCAFVAILESLNRKANELAVRQALEIRSQQAKLEHSSRLATLGEVAGGIAHEINNPLAILAGRANLLHRLADQDEAKPEVVRQNAEKIMETVDRMAKIITGLRTFSRSGDRDPFRAASIEKIFSATMDLCSERFKNQNIVFHVDPPPDIPVVCREVQVVQVLLNLLNNAYDAVQEIDERWISLSATILAERVEFAVTDSGPGIPPAVAQNMMNPFFTTKPVGQGTGLGLSISNGIAEEHGGSLRYVPTDGRTRFVFSISRKLREG